MNLLILFLSLLSTFSNLQKPNNATLNVKDFGVKGDGNTNDYFALLKAVNYINSIHGNCTLVFPAGTYVISVYNSNVNKYNDLEFDSCNNLSIIGNSAIVSLITAFNRSADYTTTGKKNITRSNNSSIVPFAFNNCNTVFLSGFEVNGNVQLISKDAGVVESASHLIKVWETTNFNMKDMIIHHAQTDGIYIGGKKKLSENVFCENVVSYSNARQALSIVALRSGKFNNCKFINTGFNTGKYGFHEPGAGVDIEPNFPSISGKKTGNITFYHCLFSNNIGGQIRNGNANAVDSIFFISDTINAGNSTKKYQLVLGSVYTKLESCYVNAGSGTMFLASVKKVDNETTDIQNSVIHIQSYGLLAFDHNGNSAVIKFSNNSVFCDEQNAQGRLQPYFIFKTKVNFNNNKIYIPKQYSNQLNLLGVQPYMITGNKFIARE